MYFPQPYGNVVCGGAALITSTEPGNPNIALAQIVFAQIAARPVFIGLSWLHCALLADSVWSRMNGWFPARLYGVLFRLMCHVCSVLSLFHSFP